MDNILSAWLLPGSFCEGGAAKLSFAVAYSIVKHSNEEKVGICTCKTKACSWDLETEGLRLRIIMGRQDRVGRRYCT